MKSHQPYTESTIFWGWRFLRRPVAFSSRSFSYYIIAISPFFSSVNNRFKKAHSFEISAVNFNRNAINPIHVGQFKCRLNIEIEDISQLTKMFSLLLLVKYLTMKQSPAHFRIDLHQQLHWHRSNLSWSGNGAWRVVNICQQNKLLLIGIHLI